MLSRSDLPAFGVRWVCTRNHVTLCEARQSVCGFQGGDLGLHEKSCCALRGATVRAWLPRWYCHQRVYMRVQGTMANFTGGPVYNPDRASLPLAHQIGLGPHVSGDDDAFFLFLQKQKRCRTVSSLWESAETANRITHLCSSPLSPERPKSWRRISRHIM